MRVSGLTFVFTGPFRQEYWETLIPGPFIFDDHKTFLGQLEKMVQCQQKIKNRRIMNLIIDTTFYKYGDYADIPNDLSINLIYCDKADRIDLPEDVRQFVVPLTRKLEDLTI
jgi:hypothetical protein